jgi:hypothetical protein
MTPAEKRVQIARDVLAQLFSKRLKAEPGVWLSGLKEKNLFTKTDVRKDPELKEILSKTKQCEGCALGGMFMCAVERADHLKLSQLDAVKELKDNQTTYLDAHISEDDAFSYMRKFFSQDQLDMIESAFEQGTGACHHYDAVEFIEGDVDPQTRMRLIMENIVANKGAFRPHEKPVATWITPGYQG